MGVRDVLNGILDFLFGYSGGSKPPTKQKDDGWDDYQDELYYGMPPDDFDCDCDDFDGD